MDDVHPDLATIALERVPGSDFEKFVHEFYPGVSGEEFVPLGGMHDGGADGFQDSGLWTVPASRRFFQASTEEDAAGKIKLTVNRLRKFGRRPEMVTYVTNRVIKHADIEEENLTRQLGVAIRIRDGRFIANNINQSPQTKAAFLHHLRHLTDYLGRPGGSELLKPSKQVSSPAVYVFLRQELERRRGNLSLLDAVIDSLALWALEGTDPDKGLFLGRDEVKGKIIGEIPTARNLIETRISKRLEAMSKKSYPGGRAINWHRKEDRFCLPYETRKVIEADNLSDELLRIAVTEQLRQRIKSLVPEPLSGEEVDIAAQVAMRSVQLSFESEGLEFAKFLELRDSGEEFPTIADHIRQAFDEVDPSHSRRLAFTEAIFVALRASFYYSSPEERQYFGRLSRTYALLFLLKTEPKLVNYFQQMAGNFYLFVGADQVIRALSERYLPEADRMTRTMFRMAIQAGAQLVLTEPVLGEVVNHLRATDKEYEANRYSELESRMTLDIARNIPKILLRAYFYAKLDAASHDGSPKNWSEYMSQFCDFVDLRKPRAFEDIKAYLLGQFGLRFQTTVELEKLVDKGRLDSLAQDLLPLKEGHETLARDDALLAMAVYGRRKQKAEVSSVSVFGYKTWWLTDEARILAATKGLIEANHGARYMMRPDFLLNFIALSPSTAQVRATFQRVFPTLLGIRMARRMDETAFHALISTTKSWDDWEEGRRVAAISKLSDALKADFRKQYAVSLKPKVMAFTGVP